MRPLLLGTLFFLLSLPAHASDGVIEINQTCAVASGCVDDSGGVGDSPGFPVTIEIPGSYVLTSHLVVTDPNQDAIFIATSPVTLDLNGFEIRGPVSCSGFGATLTCGPGTGRGIRAEGRPRITLVDGSVSGFGAGGLLVAGRSRIESLVTERNGGNGIEAGDDSVIVGSRAHRNAGAGIDAGRSVAVDRSTSSQNRGPGMELGDASIVTSATVRANGSSGILLGRGSIVKGCTVEGNASTGISSVTNSNDVVVEGNSVNGNARGIAAADGSVVRANSIKDNQLDGLLAGAGAMIQGNAIKGNQFGIAVFPFSSGPATYRENIVTDNADGAVSATHVNLGDNYCAGANVSSSSCP